MVKVIRHRHSLGLALCLGLVAVGAFSLIVVAPVPGQETKAPEAEPKAEPAKPADPSPTAAAPVEPKPAEAKKEAETKPAEIPLVIRPYRINVWLQFEDHPRLSAMLRQQATDEFTALADQFMGPAWELHFGAAPAGALITAAPAPGWVEAGKGQFDKILWIAVEAGPVGAKGTSPKVPVTVWEYDYLVEEWGTRYREEVATDSRLPRRLLELAHRQFRPTVNVAGPEKADPKKIQVTPRALRLQPEGSPLPLFQSGAPFRAYRELYGKTGLREKLFEVSWTYLIFRSATENRMSATCDLISLNPRPIARGSKRVQTIAISAPTRDDATTVVRFHDMKTQSPVVGYEVGVRIQDSDAVVPIGNTDRNGAVRIGQVRLPTDAGKKLGPQVLEVQILAGRTVLRRLPLVPGDRDVLDVPVPVDPLLTEVSGKILSLQEQLVDAVAQQAILNAQFDHYNQKDSRTEDENKKLQTVVARLNALPDKGHFLKRFEEIKQAAVSKQRVLKRERLGAPIEKLFKQTDFLLKEKVNLNKSEIQLADAPGGSAQPKATDASAETKPAAPPPAPAKEPEPPAKVEQPGPPAKAEEQSRAAPQQ